MTVAIVVYKGLIPVVGRILTLILHKGNNKNQNDNIMFEYEEQTEIIGARCTLHEAYKGYTEGTVVGDFGLRIVVQLDNGKEVVEYRDEVTIYD